MALTGKHLVVAAGDWIPWVILERDHHAAVTKGRGILFEMIDLFAKKLNFTYSIKEAPDGEWGRILPNGSTTGMIGMVHRREVDMATGPFAVTYARSQIIDFSATISYDSYGIFLPRPTLERDFAGFVKPFTWKVWTVLIILLLGSTALGVLLTRLVKRWYDSPGGFGPEDQKGRSPMTFQVQWLVKLLLAEPLEIPDILWSGRLFLLTWMFVSLIMGTCYQGILTSLLAVRKVEIPVDSIEDLASYGKMKWAIEYGTSVHQALSEAKSGTQKKIFDGASFITASYDASERIKTEKLAVLCDIYSMLTIISKDYTNTGKCNYYIAKNALWSSVFAFTFSKGSPYAPHINEIIVMLTEAGLVERYRQAFITNASACMVPPGKEDATATQVLSLADLAAIFALCLGGLVVGMVAFGLEMVIHKKTPSCATQDDD